MIQGSRSFVYFGRSTFDAALTVADITLQSTERIVGLQLKTAKYALEQGMRNVEALAEIKNVRDFVALQSKAAQPTLEKALAYSRDFYAVATEAQERIGKVLKIRMSELGGEILTAADQASKFAPGGPDAALAAFKAASAAADNSQHRVTPRANGAGKVATAKRVPGKRKPTKKKGR